MQYRYLYDLLLSINSCNAVKPLIVRNFSAANPFYVLVWLYVCGCVLFLVFEFSNFYCFCNFYFKIDYAFNF